MDERQDYILRCWLEEDVEVASDIAPSDTEDNEEECVTELNHDSETEQEYESSIEETEERSTEERVDMKAWKKMWRIVFQATTMFL
ncbi:unnamed protein product [Parnassius apollo]|uniref:(apollo) hypothetical protein n=1 Tax=Parnassius apollo TaxID=110799 RepID=A0A8S3Y9W7_PARAO|nr:unnamed protein product [Parnassius apollo]CAG5059260.1 unnamed protein product [Parnassius apollo]